MDFRIDDPSKTFWDDPNMYLDNADLDTLLSLSKDELLLGNNPDDTLVEAIDSDPNGKRGEKQWEVPNQSRSGKTNDWGKQVFACVYPNCSRSYRKPSHMKVHVRRHSGEKPYDCAWPNCGWRFARSDELIRHFRTHSGDRPYGCGTCGKQFYRSDHLTKHQRVHSKRKVAAKLRPFHQSSHPRQ